MYNNLFARQFSDDEMENEEKVDDTTNNKSGDYEFEGYKIEVNEKIMLTTITEKKQ